MIAIAGDGKLVDGGRTSEEFRSFLQVVSSKLLARYCNECLGAHFPASGLALQDAVNEVGSRLGADVSPGRYRGDQRHIGFDGLWRFPSGHAIVVEVKTTDAFSINLETIAAYRTALVAEGKVTADASSSLIIVGREDTGNLEAQIRGSPHAWDVRLISVDALLRLLALKEEVGDPTTVGRIHAILIPREFTRLDEIADILFSTAADLKEEEAVSQVESSDEREAKPAKPKFTPVAFHDACAARIEGYLGCTLVKRTRAAFSTPDKSIAVVCAVSKRHPNGDYWFAFHPHQQEFLESATTNFVAFGCGSEQKLLLIPFADFVPWLGGMFKTELEGRFYWHVSIYEGDGSLLLYRRRGEPKVDLTTYLLPPSGPSP